MINRRAVKELAELIMRIGEREGIATLQTKSACMNQAIKWAAWSFQNDPDSPFNSPNPAA